MKTDGNIIATFVVSIQLIGKSRLFRHVHMSCLPRYNVIRRAAVVDRKYNIRTHAHTDTHTLTTWQILSGDFKILHGRGSVGRGSQGGENCHYAGGCRAICKYFPLNPPMHETLMYMYTDTTCDITHTHRHRHTHTHTQIHTPHGKVQITISKQDFENCRNIWLLTVTKWQCRLFSSRWSQG